ncbi:MAG: HAD family hydrolase [Chloroflexi bacterium]|nr:HAD family hydrolase [Chloroflexota bacterium]
MTTRISNGIQAVFFDLYNTLACFSPPRHELQGQVASEFGVAVTKQGILKGYAEADALMSLENARSPIQGRSPEERLVFFTRYQQTIIKGTGADVSLETAAQMWQRLRQIPYDLALYDDVLPVIQELEQRGFTIGLISNLWRDLGEICRNLGLAPHLDVVVSSLQAGSEKPHPPIFHLALAKAGVTPSQAVHVGDQYHADVTGARAVGMTPVLLDRDGLASHPDDCLSIANLRELPSLLPATPKTGLEHTRNRID